MDIYRQLEIDALRVRNQLFAKGKRIFSGTNVLDKNKDLTLVFASFSENIDGIVYKGNKPIIIINSNQNYYERVFTFFHEYYHYKFSNIESMICNTDSFAYKNKKEEALANFFAMYILLPLSEFVNFIEKELKGVIDEDGILRLSNNFRAPSRVVLQRLFELDLISDDKYEALKDDQKLKIIDDIKKESIFQVECEEGQLHVFGWYNKQADSLLKKDKISYSKYISLLSDADIKTGLDNE